jgi:uncharacterized protein (TIGR03083 family)
MSEQSAIEGWQRATDDFIDALAEMPDWSLESACPGWTIADLVAHTADLEALLAQDERAEHNPDWSQLPHVGNDFGRFVEIGVDYRRGRSKDELLDELRDVHNRARQRITSMAPDDTISWLRGDTPRDTVVQMRTFDVWLHEQDARVVAGMPGNLDGPGAQQAHARLRSGLPKLWAKSAPPHAVLHLDVTEPGMAFEAWITIDGDGRADFADAGEASCSITMPWLTFVMLGGGRNTPVINDVAITGDDACAQAFIGRLAVTP